MLYLLLLDQYAAGVRGAVVGLLRRRRPGVGQDAIEFARAEAGPIAFGVLGIIEHLVFEADGSVMPGFTEIAADLEAEPEPK